MLDIRNLLTVDVPEGEYGTAQVQRFEVSQEAAKFDALRGLLGSGAFRCTPAGTYTQLTVNGRLWMSDTPDERRDHYEPVYHAYRNDSKTALVSGLGLGMVVGALLRLDNIEAVTVVELNEDVVHLVGWHYQELAASLGKSFEVVRGDARDPAKLFPSGSYWDVAWHDIWPDLCTDNLDEMAMMSRRYARRTGWQGFWGRELLRSQRRREQRQMAWWS